MKSSQIGVSRLWASVFIVKSVQGMAGFLRKGMGLMLARGELRLLGWVRRVQTKLTEQALRLIRPSSVSAVGHVSRAQVSYAPRRLGQAKR